MKIWSFITSSLFWKHIMILPLIPKRAFNQKLWKTEASLLAPILYGSAKAISFILDRSLENCSAQGSITHLDLYWFTLAGTQSSMRTFLSPVILFFFFSKKRRTKSFLLGWNNYIIIDKLLCGLHSQQSSWIPPNLRSHHCLKRGDHCIIKAVWKWI